MRILDDLFAGDNSGEPDPSETSGSTSVEAALTAEADPAVEATPTAESAVAVEPSAGKTADVFTKPSTEPAPALPAWADEILDEVEFTEPDGADIPPIWSHYRRAVESTVDEDLRASVLRAGWSALRGPIASREA